MCGRYIKGHMKLHSEQHTHPLVLSFSDLSVWCYGCESYIDASVSFPVHSNYTCLNVCFFFKALHESKNAAHLAKFGTEKPWTYGGIEME